MASSCDKPRCENSNPIYVNNTIDSKVYNDELVRELSTEDNLTFWLKDVISENGKDYLLVNIHNNNVCATGQFIVNDWNTIEDLEKNKGAGRRGAQLQGFKYSIAYSLTGTTLLFKSISGFID